MLIHGAFDSHLNRFPAAGARILNLTEGTKVVLDYTRDGKPAKADLVLKVLLP